MIENKDLSNIDIADNCLTWIHQFSDGEYPYYADLQHMTMFQYVRKGGAYRYKILEDPDDAEYIETADDSASQNILEHAWWPSRQSGQ